MSMENRSMNNNRGNRSSRTASELMDIITKVSFAMDDTRLFLDTHPDCSEAMEYFRRMHRIRHEAEREYTERFGQVVSYHIDGCDTWDWNSGPLPWRSSRRGDC